MRDPERLRAFAEGYTAAWCSMDPTRVAGRYAPGGSLTINDGPPAIGRAAIAAAARGFYEALPDMQVFMDDLVVEGDRIEYHWTFTGTNTGPGGTGNAVRVSGFEEWTIDDRGSSPPRWATTTLPNTRASSSAGWADLLNPGVFAGNAGLRGRPRWSACTNPARQSAYSAMRNDSGGSDD